MDNTRINENIKAKEVRLIDGEGQPEVVPIDEALKRAEIAELDLVEMAGSAVPPVCKIMDYGKFLYQKEKKVKEARKKQVIVEVKEMKFGPKIDKHDFEYRMKRIIEFLDGGDKIKITIRFRGRELAHTEIGFDLAKKILESAKDHCTIEKYPKLEGRNITAFLAPIVKKK